MTRRAGAWGVTPALVILALILAPVLASLDMGKAMAGSGHHGVGTCAESCAPHHQPQASHHGGAACAVSCAAAALFALAPAMAQEAARGEPQPLASGRFPARTSWPPPLPPPRG